MKWYWLFFSLGFQSCMYGIFEYDRAIRAAQRNDWHHAKQMLKNLLVHHADQPDVLYDAGVASYKTGEFDTAHAYFNASAQCADAHPHLKEQAYFNSGNSLVQVNKLDQAIEQYEKVLALNPDNAQARHNLEQIKKKKEEQQKKEQEEQNKKQNQKPNKDQNDQKNNERNQDESHQNNKQDNQDQNDTPHDKDRQEQSSQHEKKNQEDKQKKDAQSNQQQSEHQAQQQPPSSGKNQNKQASNNDMQHNMRNTSAQQTPSADKNRQEKQAQDHTRMSQTQHDTYNKQHGAIAQLLAEREKRDKQMSKLLMQAQVQKTGSKDNDEHNW